MQNGHFNHNDRDVIISSTGSWNEEGHPNAVPFYMSLKGYGAFRNTYARGVYSFRDPVRVEHEETRFDCYYFYGPSLKKILDGYTLITGRPFMTPIWAMEFGDADRDQIAGVGRSFALRRAGQYEGSPAGHTVRIGLQRHQR